MQKQIQKKQKELKLYILISILIALFVGSIAGVFGSFFLKPYLDNTEWGREFLKTNQFKDNDQENANQIIAIKEDSATIEAVKKVTPSVVSIVVTKELENIFNMTGPGLERVLEQDIQELQRRSSIKEEIGGGTGFVIDEKGLILTNRHVVEDEDAEYTVIMSDGTKYVAEVLGRDMIQDIAILRIEAEGLEVAELGNSVDLQIGQTVIAIGNALTQYRNTVTKGVISGIDREIIAGGYINGAELMEGALQTDAAINPGNSGGPLINLAGQVIGINTAINMGGQSLSFAIPVDQAKNIIDSVKKFGKIVRPWIGVRYLPLNKAIAEKNSIKYDYGALIYKEATASSFAVVPDSPADKAGLVQNDIILEVNGQRIDEDNTLLKTIAEYSPGETIEIKYFHEDEELITNIELVERPEGM